jgi:hypothetical protein
MTDSPPSANYVVLMTATIAPKARMSAAIRRSDPVTRLADYQRAMEFWLQLPAPWMSGIVFAENSGYPLDALRDLAAASNPRRIPVEFLSFDDSEPPEGLHYGYTEIKLVREAMRGSGLIAANRYVIKATGRYTFPDISRLVSRLPKDFAVAVDARCARPFSRNRHFLVQVALAIFERAFFLRELADLPERMTPAPPWNRCQFVETVLYDRLVSLRSEPGVILRWPCNCESRGIGSNGDSYSSAKKRLQRTLRAAARVVAPDLWI